MESISLTDPLVINDLFLILKLEEVNQISEVFFFFSAPHHALHTPVPGKFACYYSLILVKILNFFISILCVKILKFSLILIQKS